MPDPTPRRKRQVRWGKRMRRLGLAWQNALEIARAGRLTAPYSVPFEVEHEERVWRLRHYGAAPAPGATTIAAPLLLVPPLMVASEVYDISPDVSAIAFLQKQGVDVWLIDFGAPEREEGGMSRTLDDHVRAVSDAIDRVRGATGHDVHLCGYSQGGMFCYQAAAFRRSAGLASIVTAGSPVDLHRQLPLAEDTTERIVAGMRAAFAWPLARLPGLPGFFTSTGFKLMSARKEAMQLVDFVRNLHDRQALEKREAKRLFLGGEGFVAWPGPAFRKFVDDVIVGNRMASGGFVIDGHTVTLADLTCPILYFVGSRDEMGRPASVRGIRRAAPRVSRLYEVPLKAGHFGLVVGSTALTITWPSVVAWMKHLAGEGPLPEHAFDARAKQPVIEEDDRDDGEDDDHDHDNLELARDLIEKTGKAALARLGELSEDLGSYLDNARYQLPRLHRLRNLQDDSFVSLGRTLADQARDIGDKTFFLWRGRAFTYAEANRRVDSVVLGLIACGIAPGQRVAVMMKSRPSHLSVVAAINRLGAIAVLISPETPDAYVQPALELGEAEIVIVDPDGAARTRTALPAAFQIFVLGGVGEPRVIPDAETPMPSAEETERSRRSMIASDPRGLPAGVVDMETIDVDRVTPPSWYRADQGRARDLAMIFVAAGKVAAYDTMRATRITNRRWAFAALGAAAAATLTMRDTVYCCLPLHHPSGTLVAAGSALVGGARLALASRMASNFEPHLFWDEVRRYGASVVYYAGEMCRALVDAPPVLGENNSPVRLFAGSGMRVDVWKRLVERFGPVGVCELYASTEAHTVLANASGKAIGSVGRPLPGSPEVVVAAWNFEQRDFVRDGRGHLVRARLDEPGVLVARLRAGVQGEIAHIDPRRLLRDAFEPGDTWFNTADVFEVDTLGDFYFVDRAANMIATPRGPIASTRIEDAVLAVPGVALCAAVGDRLAIELRPTARLDLVALSLAIATLPEYGRPHRVKLVAEIPMTDGFRPMKRVVDTLDFGDAANVYRWDTLTQRLVATLATSAAG